MPYAGESDSPQFCHGGAWQVSGSAGMVIHDGSDRQNWQVPVWCCRILHVDVRENRHDPVNYNNRTDCEIRNDPHICHILTQHPLTHRPIEKSNRHCRYARHNP